MRQSQCERDANSAANPLSALRQITSKDLITRGFSFLMGGENPLSPCSQGELESPAERAPGKDPLPSPLGRPRRIGPSRQRVPPVCITAEQNRVVRRQILPTLGHARYQGEAIAQLRRLVECGCVGSAAAQQIEPSAAGCGPSEKTGYHPGNA